MTLTEVLGVLGFIAGTPSVVLSLYNLMKARVEKQRLDAEVADRRAVEARAVDLVRQLPPAAAAARGQPVFQQFVLGADPVLDRAVRLLREWRAVLIRWNEGSYQVRLRGLNEPPDPNQQYGWH